MILLAFGAGFVIGCVIAGKFWRWAYMRISKRLVAKYARRADENVLSMAETMTKFLPEGPEKDEWERKIAIERLTRE